MVLRNPSLVTLAKFNVARVQNELTESIVATSLTVVKCVVSAFGLGTLVTTARFIFHSDEDCFAEHASGVLLHGDALSRADRV